MLRVFATILISFWAFTVASVAKATVTTMQLTSERVLDLQKAPKTITISDPNVLDVQRLGLTNSVRLVPQSNGKANLLLEFPDGSSKEYRIGVAIGREPTNALGISQSAGVRIARALSQISGVETFVENGRVVVTGTLKTIDDFRTAGRIIASSPQSFLCSFSVSPGIESMVAEDLTRTVSALGGSLLNVTQRQGLTILGGISETAVGKQNALTYLRSMFPGTIDAASEQEGSLNLVQIELHFLEISRSESSQFGIKRNGSPLIGIDFGPSLTGESAILTTNLNLFLDALQQSQGARELANPTLLTRSGKEVEFLAGGEVPIVAGRENAGTPSTTLEKVEYKPYGISFRSSPTLLPNGKIILDINAQFSGIDEGLSRDLAPAFHSRRLQTSIAIEADKAAILTGLVRSSDSKGIEKMPLLGSIPILGEFFKHRNLKDDNTELWITVSARPTRDAETLDVKKTWKQTEPSVRGSFFD